MKGNYELENRQYVIGGVAVVIVIVYLIRLFSLQIMSDDYKKNADSNAFLKKVEFPARGTITDRNGKLMVYNQPAFDLMVVMNEEKDHLDTLEFCQSLGITKEYFIKRMNDIKDRSKNPGYSRFTQQLFMSQLSDKEFSIFQEKMYRFPGFYVQRRTIRQYVYPYAAHVLGDVAEVSPSDIEDDDYYQPGDYIGKLGVERSYEKQLRGEKGVQILLRDAHGRIKGRYQNGALDRRPKPGKDLTLSIDIDLQALGERLLEGTIHRRGALQGEFAHLRPARDDRPTARKDAPRTAEKRVETAAQPQYHGTISAGFHLQDLAGTHLHDRGYHQSRDDAVPLSPRLLLPRIARGLPRPRFAPFAGARHQYLV